MRTGADTLKRVTLELGGKSPNIVFADAEFDAAIQGSANGIFWNQGEICSAGSRVFVERAIYDDALNALVGHAQAVTLGDGKDEATTMGPLVSKEQQERVLSYIEIGQGEAKMAVQGESPTDPKLANGYFVPPTIFADVDNNARIAREEIFGPVMSVIPFTSADEVIELSNDNEYGLAAAVWTRDIKKGLNTAKALRAGIVWINDSQPAPTETPLGRLQAVGDRSRAGSRGTGRLPRGQAHLREPGRLVGRDQARASLGANMPPAMMPNVATTITLMAARRLKLCAIQPSSGGLQMNPV